MKISRKQLQALIESEIKKKITENVVSKAFNDIVVSALATTALSLVEDAGQDLLVENTFEVLMGSATQFSDDEKYVALAEISDNSNVYNKILDDTMSLIVRDLRPIMNKCLSDLIDATLGTLEDDVL